MYKKITFKLKHQNVVLMEKHDRDYFFIWVVNTNFLSKGQMTPAYVLRVKGFFGRIISKQSDIFLTTLFPN